MSSTITGIATADVIDGNVITPKEQKAFESWLTKGIKMFTVNQKSQWDTADWYVAGMDGGYVGTKFDLEARLDALFGGTYSLKTIRPFGSVARAFPADQRNLSVSFGVHRALASLPEAERFAALAQAAEGNWTVKNAADAVAAAKVKAELSGSNAADAADDSDASDVAPAPVDVQITDDQIAAFVAMLSPDQLAKVADQVMARLSA